MSDLMTKYRNNVFGKKFSERLKDLKYTNREFIKLYKEKTNGLIVTENSVSAWKHGKAYPDKEHFKMICSILKVDESYFTELTRAEKYLSPEDQKKIAAGHYKTSTEIGLSIEFIRALKEILDFDNSFPQYSPLFLDGDLLSTTIQYKRRPFAEAGEADPNHSDFQVVNDGHRRTLHVADLYYLKEIQDKVSEYVTYLFWKRSQDMIHEEQAVNEMSHSKDSKGIEFIGLSEKDLQRLDPYRKYLYTQNQEEKAESENNG